MLERLHPLVVHFPVVLVPLAGAFCLWEQWRPSRRRQGMIDWILALGVAGALFAALTGEAALEELDLAFAASEAAEAHEDIASVAAWLASAALVLRGVARLSGRADRSSRLGSHRSIFTWLATLACCLAAFAVLWAGYRGGVLVHEFGVTRVTVPLRVPETPAGHDSFESGPADSL